MLKSRLAVYVWGPASGVTQFQDISALVENLSFSSLAPGGFGTLTGLVRLTKPQIPRPQFGLFSRVAIISRGQAIWLGELVNPSYGINESNGDYIKLNALGLGNALRDNPNTWSYSGQTPQAIAQDQMNQILVVKHAYSGLFSTDYSALFADNPAVTITQAYDERTAEEILQDIALQAGDYNWGVEADPAQKDSAGFPLGRVYIRKRDLATVGYTASLAAKDVVMAEFTPTANRAYNQIQIDYSNGTTGVGKARATDTRVNADQSQGSAPFRWRKYLRDLSGNSLINATIAQSIASTYLGLFENITYQGSLTLRGLRDAQGNPIPLWEAQAGTNLFVPELAIQAATLPGAPTQNANLFWITSATYHEDSSGAQLLDLQVGYLPETPDVRVTRLQMVADALSRSGKVTNVVQALGAQLQGYYGFDFSNATLGQNVGVGVTFQRLCSQAPTSLTLTSITQTNVSGLAYSNLNAVGAHIGGTATAAGAGQAIGTYLTNGNCLRHVDVATGRFAKHCDICDGVFTDLSIAEHVEILTHHGRRPGGSALAVECPRCGVGKAREVFNTGLTARDEEGEWAHRATQARLIRQLMVACELETA